MRGTNHPNIVKLISFSESDEYYYLVLERESTISTSHWRHDVLTSTINPVMEGGELFHQM